MWHKKRKAVEIEEPDIRTNRGRDNSDAYGNATSLLYDEIPGRFVLSDSGGSPVPEPATVLLLGSGLMGLAGFRRRFRRP